MGHFRIGRKNETPIQLLSIDILQSAAHTVARIRPGKIIIMLLDRPDLSGLIQRFDPHLIMLLDPPVRDASEDHRSNTPHIEVVIDRNRSDCPLLRLDIRLICRTLKKSGGKADEILFHYRIILKHRSFDQRGDLIRLDIILQNDRPVLHPCTIKHQDPLGDHRRDLRDHHDRLMRHGNDIK